MGWKRDAEGKATYLSWYGVTREQFLMRSCAGSGRLVGLSSFLASGASSAAGLSLASSWSMASPPSCAAFLRSLVRCRACDLAVVESTAVSTFSRFCSLGASSGGG